MPYHHGNLREVLLEKAADAIEEDGIGALSLRAVARRAGVSHGAPAHHFRDKTGLLTALATQAMGRLRAALSHAAREAYRGLIEANRFPVFFIALKVDPQAVDVNVHPTKSEVRWRESNLIYSQVLSALRDKFLNANLTPGYLTEGPRVGKGVRTGAPATTVVGPEPADAEAADDLEAAHHCQIRQSIADFFKRTSPAVDGAPTAPGAMPPKPTP